MGVLMNFLIAMIIIGMLAMGLGSFVVDFGYRNTTSGTIVRIVDRAPASLEANITWIQSITNTTESIVDITDETEKIIRDMEKSSGIVENIISGAYLVIVAIPQVFVAVLGSVSVFIGAILPHAMKAMMLPAWFSGGIIAIVVLIVVFAVLSALLGRKI